MKRFLFLLSFVCAYVISFAQEMPSVAGVKFGWSYSQCKQILDNRFNGGNSSYQYVPNELYYYDIFFANEYFDYVRFRFQIDSSNNTYLNYVSFFASFDINDAKNVKDKRDRLFKFYNEKYDFRWSDVDKDGWKYYVLGHDPFKFEDGFIVISANKINTQAGVLKLWTEIDYGPINFIDPQGEI